MARDMHTKIEIFESGDFLQSLFGLASTKLPKIFKIPIVITSCRQCILSYSHYNSETLQKPYPVEDSCNRYLL